MAEYAADSVLSGRPRQQKGPNLRKQLRTTSSYVYCYVVPDRSSYEGGWWLEQTTTKTKKEKIWCVLTYLKKDKDFYHINRLVASLDLNWTDVVLLMLLCYWHFVVQLFCTFFIM